MLILVTSGRILNCTQEAVMIRRMVVFAISLMVMAAPTVKADATLDPSTLLLPAAVPVPGTGGEPQGQLTLDSDGRPLNSNFRIILRTRDWIQINGTPIQIDPNGNVLTMFDGGKKAMIMAVYSDGTRKGRGLLVFD